MNVYFDLALSFVTLTILEIVLGIDNLVFLAIISQKLPKAQQAKARRIGLSLAWILRLCLLASAVWIVKLKTPLITLFDFAFSGRDLFLFFGGLFLLYKATQEMHVEIDQGGTSLSPSLKKATFTMVIFQIAVLDIIFSLDSVLTAIGLTDNFWLMTAAITIAILAMLFASEPLSKFVERYPTVKMLALSFLLLIGMVLIADAFHFHIPRGYVYFAMGFSLFTELMNILRRVRREKARNRINP